ncbi:DNA primase [Halothiobacillus sp. DCM-1]|uniref:DNA primase n=1 Tax=Halothiobacillus sp. DCM-1 TaxID=3112558 RepID=UPI003246029C
MSRLPESFIEEVLARVDLVALIDRRVPLKKKGREYAACCPFHQEKTPSFYVNPDKQFYHCFGCGAHGNALKFLMDYEHQDFRGAMETLANEVGMTLPNDPQADAEHDALAGLYAAMEAAQTHFQQALRHAPATIDYLKARGVTGETAARFGLGFAPGSPGLAQLAKQDATRLSDWETLGLIGRREDGSLYDRFRNRLMIPIRDRRGRVIGFGGRIIGTGEPKYLNSPENPLFHKGAVLYGLYEARQANARPDSLLIVEGYLDVIMLAQHGIPQVVATMGTATTPEQITLLFRHTPQLVFCFDGDAAGHRAAAKALQAVLPQLIAGRGVRFLFLPDGEDPDSFVRTHGAQAFLTRVESLSLSLEHYLLRRLDQMIPGQDAASRAAKAKLGQEWTATMPPGDFRKLIEQHIKEHLGLWRTRPQPQAPHPPVRARQEQPIKRTPESLILNILLRYPELAHSAADPQHWHDGVVPELLHNLGNYPAEGWAQQPWFIAAAKEIQAAREWTPPGTDTLAQAQAVLTDALTLHRQNAALATQRSAAKAALDQLQRSITKNKEE